MRESCVKAENGLPCRLSAYFAAEAGCSLCSRQNPLLPLDWPTGMWHCFWSQGHESGPLTVCVLCLNLQQHPWPLRLPLFPEDAAGSAEGDTVWLAGEENAWRHGPEVPASCSGKQGRLHQRWGTRAVVVAVPTSAAYINNSTESPMRVHSHFLVSAAECELSVAFLWFAINLCLSCMPFLSYLRLHRPASHGKCQPHRVRCQSAPIQSTISVLPDLWPADRPQKHRQDDLLEQIRTKDSICKALLINILWYFGAYKVQRYSNTLKDLGFSIK